MNIILDTNAIKYFYQIKNGENINIKLNGKQVDNNIFVELCENAESVYVMAGSHLELFFQSYKKENSLTEYMAIYNCLCSSVKKNGHRLYTISDINGFYFDTNKLKHAVKLGEKIDLNVYIGARVEGEVRLIYSIIQLVSYSVIGLVFDNVFDVIWPDEYWDGLYNDLKAKLRQLYSNYYIGLDMEIKEFEKELDRIIYENISTINNNTNILARVFGDGELLPQTRGENCGAEYTRKIIKNLDNIAKRKYNRSSLQMYEQNLDEFLARLKQDKEYSSLRMTYLKYLCMGFANGRKIKKNDILDYAMVTSLDKTEEIIQNQTSEESIFISFDNFVNSFCKEKSLRIKFSTYEDVVVKIRTIGKKYEVE